MIDEEVRKLIDTALYQDKKLLKTKEVGRRNISQKELLKKKKYCLK